MRGVICILRQMLCFVSIIYIVLAYYIFLDIWEMCIVKAFSIAPPQIPYSAIPICILTGIGSIILLTTPLIIMTKRPYKRELFFCSMIAYALQSYICTVVFAQIDYLKQLVNDYPVIFYLLIQLIILFFFQNTWKQLKRKEKYFIFFLNTGGLIGILFWVYSNGYFEYQEIYISIRFIKIIMGL